MRVVFVGTPHVAVPSLRALVESHHEIAAVITRPDAESGRGRKSRSSPVARAAEQCGLAVLKPVRLDDEQFVRQLSDITPDCCPVVAYGGLVPGSLLQLPTYGWLNLHFSLLPAWRGAAPVQHAVLSGDEVTGATTFALEASLDTGPVFGTVTEPIQPTDTSGELLRRLAVSGAALLIRTIDALESGEVVAVPQPTTGISYAPKLVVDDARVDWGVPALRVDRVVRATTPEPGAWTTFRSSRLKLGVVQPLPSADTLAPGSIALARSDVRVGTGSHPVRLSQVQPTGKQWMPAADWARGVRLDPDDRLQ